MMPDMAYLPSAFSLLNLLATIPSAVELASRYQEIVPPVYFRQRRPNTWQSILRMPLRGGGEETKKTISNPRKRKSITKRKAGAKSFRRKSCKWKRKKKSGSAQKNEGDEEKVEESSVHIYDQEPDNPTSGVPHEISSNFNVNVDLNASHDLLKVGALPKKPVVPGPNV